MTANEWNARYRVGTKVRYRPSIHNPDAYIDTETTRPAWKAHGEGHAVVALKGLSGSKTIEFLEVLAPNASAETRNLKVV